MRTVRVVRRAAPRSSWGAGVEERIVDLGAKLLELETLLYDISKEVSEIQKVFIPKDRI